MVESDKTYYVKFGYLNDVWLFNMSSESFVEYWGSGKADQDANFSEGYEHPGGIHRSCGPNRLLQNKIMIYGGQQWINGAKVFVNLLWSFDVATKQWSLMSGDEAGQGAAIYGEEDIADAANTPASV